MERMASHVSLQGNGFCWVRHFIDLLVPREYSSFRSPSEPERQLLLIWYAAHQIIKSSRLDSELQTPRSNPTKVVKVYPHKTSSSPPNYLRTLYILPQYALIRIPITLHTNFPDLVSNISFLNIPILASILFSFLPIAMDVHLRMRVRRARGRNHMPITCITCPYARIRICVIFIMCTLIRHSIQGRFRFCSWGGRDIWEEEIRDIAGPGWEVLVRWIVGATISVLDNISGKY